jgi:hypothetical protein
MPCRYESVFTRNKEEAGGGGAWLPGFAELFYKTLEEMEQDSSSRLLAGVRIQGEGGQGDVSLDEAIPKYLQRQQQPDHHQQQLLSNAIKAEAEIFYSCTSRDLSFLHGAHEPYHLGESGDYIMTQVFGFETPGCRSSHLQC